MCVLLNPYEQQSFGNCDPVVIEAIPNKGFRACDENSNLYSVLQLLLS